MTPGIGQLTYLSFEEDAPTTLARDLHDSVAQALTSMLMQMENFKAAQYGRESVLREIDAYQRETRDVLHGIRRALFELRGEEAATPDFVPSLRRRLQQLTSRYEMPIRLLVSKSWTENLSAQAARLLGHILGEALHYAHRHSGASEAKVRLNLVEPRTAEVSVRDNGRGIRPDTELGGMGLRGMRERVLVLGGSIQITPAVPHGTIVRAAFPKENLL